MKSAQAPAPAPARTRIELLQEVEVSVDEDVIQVVPWPMHDRIGLGEEPSEVGAQQFGFGLPRAHHYVILAVVPFLFGKIHFY